LCQALLRGLEVALGEKLHSIYLYGALAFPEAGATGDIDFHAILTETPDDRERSAIEDLHATLAREYPPLGVDLDGYYILLEDARRRSPPRHQLRPDIVDNSWALHRAHIRAGRCIILRGPDPTEIYPPVSWPELEVALQRELDYVENHLTDYPAYCVLNLCRLIYSFETGDVVVSKYGSARWAYDALPAWRPHVEAARRSYERTSTSRDEAFLEAEVGPFFDFAVQRIEASRSR
jgi:hypothetical protein